MTGAKPVFDMTGATPIEAIQPQQSAAALKATVNPTSLFEGVNPDTIARIKSIIGKEEESKMQVASYMSRSQNVPFKAVMSEYDAFAAQSGFEGNNATAHYTFLVNKLGKQWQHIKKTEEIIGAKSLWGSAWPTSTPLPAMSGYVGGVQGRKKRTLLQAAIPDLRSNIELLSKPSRIKSYLLATKEGGAQVLYGAFMPGVNRLAGGMLNFTTRNFGVSTDFFEENAEFWDQYADKRQMDSKVPPEIQDSIYGKIAAGIGGLPVFGVMATTGVVGTAAMVSSMYQEGVDFYRNAIPEEDRSATGEFFFSLTYGFVGTRLEKIGFKQMLKPLFETGKKLSLRQIVNRLSGLPVAAGTEITTELLQQTLLNAEMLFIDPDATAFGEVFELENLIVTSAVASFGSGFTTSIGVTSDIAAGFYPNPLTTDGHAPPANFIRKMVEREGLDAVKERFDDSDPRKELIDDIVSDNANVRIAAEARMEELTAPNPDGRALDMDDVLGTSEETKAIYKRFLEANERDEATIPKEEDVLSQPLFSEEETSAIDEMLVEESKDDTVTAEEAKLFEAKIQEELAGTKDENVFAEDIIEMSGPIDPDLSQADQAAADAELRRMLGVSRNTPEEQKLLNAWKAVVEAEEKGAKAKRGEQVKTETLRKKLEAKAESLNQEVQAMKAKDKADVAADRVKASERIVAQRVKSKSQKTDELNKLKESALKKVKKLEEKIKKIRENAKRDREGLELAISDLDALVKQFPKNVRDNLRPYFKILSKKKGQEAQQRVLNRAMSKLIELSDNLFRVEAQQRLRGTIKDALKRQKSAMELDTFKEIQEASKMSRAEADAKAEGKLSKESPSQKSIESAFILRAFGGTLNPKENIGFSAAQMEAAASEAEFILEKGRAQISKRQREREEYLNGLIKTITEEVSEKGVPRKDRKSLENAEKTLKGKLKRYANNFFGSTDGLEMLFDNLMSEGVRFSSKAHEEVYRKAWMNNIDKFSATQEDVALFESLIEEVLSDKASDTQKKWREPVENSRVHYISQGISGEKTLTVWEGIELWLRIHEGGNRETILKMLGVSGRPKIGKGATVEEKAQQNEKIKEWEAEADAKIQSLKDQVESFIGTSGVNMATGLQDIYRTLGKKHIRKEQEINSRTPNIVQNYAGFLHRLFETKTAEDALALTGADDMVAFATENGSFIERTKSTAEIVINSADTSLMQHIHSMNHAYAYAEWSRMMNRLLADREFQRTVRQRTGGTFVLKMIKRQAEIVSRGYVKRDIADAFMGGIMKNIVRSKLALNFTSAVKQIASQLAYVDTPNMPIGAYVKYWVKSRKSRSGHWKKIMMLLDSDYMKERYASGFDVTGKTLKGSNKVPLNKKSLLDYYDQNGLIATEFFDGMAILQGGQPVYDWAYDVAFKETGNHKEANNKAMIIFAEATERVQQSSAPTTISFFQSMGVLGRLFTAFQTSPLQYNRTSVNAIRARANKRISTVSLAKTLFVFQFLMPQLFTAMGSAVLAALFPDERDWEKIGKRQMQALVLQNFQAVPLLGFGAVKLTNELFGNRFPDPSVMVLDQIIQISSGIAKMVKGVNDGDDEKVEKGFADILEGSGDFFGAPTAITKKIAKTIEANSEVDVPLVD
tara:strand:+ start:747 stop:5621 length:4875 start_codon:yes stop_codon:yes gene_type:complete